MGAWLALKAWGATKSLRKWAAWVLFVIAIALMAFALARGIENAITRSIADAYTRGYTVGKAAAEAQCRNDYLDAVTRAQSAGKDAELAAWRSSAARAKSLQASQSEAESIAHEPRAPVPPGCPRANPRSVRLVAAEADAVRAEQDRLQGIRAANDRNAGRTGAH